jgi:hypothetical protein
VSLFRFTAEDGVVEATFGLFCLGGRVEVEGWGLVTHPSIAVQLTT